MTELAASVSYMVPAMPSTRTAFCDLLRGRVHFASRDHGSLMTAANRAPAVATPNKSRFMVHE